MRREAVRTRGEEGRDLPDGENRLDVSRRGVRRRDASSGSGARRRDVVMTYPRPAGAKNRGGGGEHLSYAAMGGEARGERRSDGRGRRCVRSFRFMDRFIPFQVNSFHPASPDGAPGKIAVPLHRFHFHHGVPRSKERERASRVSYQVLHAPPERISQGGHIPRFH